MKKWKKLLIPKLKGETNDVRWYPEDEPFEAGKLRGYGFVSRTMDDAGLEKIGLIKCPECNKENYAMNVISGNCTWCPFQANANPLTQTEQ